MVQSNAILTFEKRDPQPSAPIEGPRIEDIDHVCLPRLGLILSMIITTLLALVAVAGAISCWLMAYRRRPSSGRRPLANSVTASTLSHPHYHQDQADYGRAMYASPEPAPEPIPDYYNHAAGHRSADREEHQRRRHRSRSRDGGYSSGLATSRSVHGM